MDRAVAAGYSGGSLVAVYRALRQETGGLVNVWTYAWVTQTVGEFQGDVAPIRQR